MSTDQFPLCANAGFCVAIDRFGVPIIQAVQVEYYLAKQAELTKSASSVNKPNNNYRETKETDSVEFFKGSHFDHLQSQYNLGTHPNRSYGDAAAEIANRLLKERGTVVYGTGPYIGFLNWNIQPGLRDTHAALLIDIQPIAKEEPDSWERIGRGLMDIGQEGPSMDDVHDLIKRARKLAEGK